MATLIKWRDCLSVTTLTVTLLPYVQGDNRDWQSCPPMALFSVIGHHRKALESDLVCSLISWYLPYFLANS